MTATEFTTQALEWIAAAGTIITAAGLAYFKLKAQFQSQIDDLNAKHQHNTDVLQSHENRITAIDDPTGQPASVAYPPMTPMQPVEMITSDNGEVKSHMVMASLPDPQAFRQPLGKP